MPVLSTAEILLGLSRHLSAYATSTSTAALDQLAFAGSVYEMAWRLRGSGVSTARRVGAIGIEARIGNRRLLQEVLPALEQLGWVSIQRADGGEVTRVLEFVPPASELTQLADAVLDIALPTRLERAALDLLQATTRQPLTLSGALDECSEHGEEAGRDALQHLISVRLVRKVTSDDGREVVFNPNIWVGDSALTAAALRAEDAQIQTEIGALIEEVSTSPGLPVGQVQSTERRWVDFAVSQGLVERTVVQTTDGRERAFLFTPHMNRDPFGEADPDSSGHVRQLVGSMVYATTYPNIRLRDPAQFVRALIRDGEAGDASPIGTDYPMLETAGIVRVIEGSRSDRYRFQLLQADVAERALEILQQRGSAQTGSHSASSLSAQRSYVHLEQERARLAVAGSDEDAETSRLISALRDSTARRDFRGP